MGRERGGGEREREPRDREERSRERTRRAVERETNLGRKKTWKIKKLLLTAEPSGPLAAAIDRDFGSLDAFKKEFSTAGATQFGSGWAWLVLEKATGKLAVRKTGNAETPLTDGAVVPVLTMDGAFFSFYLSFSPIWKRRVGWKGRVGWEERERERE